MFRFTIRDVLWLAVVVAMGFAWWVERRARDKEWKTTDTYVHTSQLPGESRFYKRYVEHREKKGEFVR